MSAYIKNTATAELLSQQYGLRAVEIVDKMRFLGCNRKDHTIHIKGKGGRERDIHLLPEDYDSVIQWYNDPQTITYQTLYNRIGKTHKGRRDRYDALPKGAGLEVFIAVGKELGHSLEVAVKHYNLRRIEEARKESLKYLSGL